MIKTYQAAPDIDVLVGEIPIPGLGVLPVNSFVLQGMEPILVDTGAVIHRDAFLSALGTVVDPMKLRWIWLTHPDPDHIGALHPLLNQNPDLKVITTFLGVGIMGLHAPLPMDRVYFLNPGETATFGGRDVAAVKPPAFDNPSTTGFFDIKSRTLLSSDCFGAVTAEPPEDASDLSEEDLRFGQTLWATIDAPWLHKVDRKSFSDELDSVRKLDPRLILSSHLPKADGRLLPRLLDNLGKAPEAPVFVGPDQAALQQMLAQMAAE